MKNRLIKIKLMMILVEIIGILCLLEFSYSRFKSTRSGDLNGRVLKWHFELDDGIEETEAIDFPITRTDTNETVPKGMIAPGTCGEIPIVIDTTGCETDMECEIELTIENCPTNMSFRREFLETEIQIETQRSGTGEENDPKIAKLKHSFGISSENSGILEEKILWSWDYETRSSDEDHSWSDEKDTVDQRNDITFDIKVTGQQIISNPIYVLLKDDTLIFRDYDFSDEEKSTYIYYGDCCNKNEPAWYKDRDEIVHINIETPISPRRTDSWFFKLTKLENISNIENLDTSNVTSMERMFYECSSLTELDLSNFNTSNVIDMGGMFFECSSLTELNLSNFNTSNVTNMEFMFGYCSSLTELNLSNFNTLNVTNMDGMFEVCENLTELNLSGFNTSNVTDMEYMFCYCSSLTELNLSSFNTSNVTNMEYMFCYCSSLTKLNLSSFNTSNVTNMGYMFCYCSSLTELNLSSFNTSNVKYMDYMFFYCSRLTELDLSNFNTTNVTNMGYMFCSCSSLTELDLSSFNTSNVTNMAHMFTYCSNLVTIYVSTFDTTNATNSTMFSNCYSLVGGSGTTYLNTKTNKTYARIDDPSYAPGYFTLKIP